MVVGPPPQHRSVGRHSPEKERVEYVHPIHEVNEWQQFNEDMFPFSKNLLTRFYWFNNIVVLC